jgi:nucleoside-diphosphate-sugar epimerase
MQGLLNFRQSITQKSAFFAQVGDARISAVDVRDLADVAVAALTTSQHDDKIYPLTGPDALTFADMAQQLSKAVGRAIMFVDVPPESMRVALADLDFPAWQADGLLEEFAMYRRGEAAGVEPGVRQALGRPPRSFEDFARDCSPNRQQQTEPEWYFLTPHRSEAVSAKRPVSFALPMAAGPRSRVSRPWRDRS